MSLRILSFLSLAIPALAYPQEPSPPPPPPACPPNLKNIIFNGIDGDGGEPPQSSIDAITGATNWITFGPPTGTSTAKQIPMMAFASDVPRAMSLVQGPEPPEFLLTFNEPDFSYDDGKTPTMTPQEAAANIQDLFRVVTNATKLISPAVALSKNGWLDQFYEACNCRDRFYAYNMHLYKPHIQDALDVITYFHEEYNDKPLWITEIAPGGAEPSCSIAWDTTKEYMSTVYRWGAQQGYIERIFWNSGNQMTNGDVNVCNSYLIGADGTPSPLLEHYNNLGC